MDKYQRLLKQINGLIKENKELIEANKKLRHHYDAPQLQINALNRVLEQVTSDERVP